MAFRVIFIMSPIFSALLALNGNISIIISVTVEQFVNFMAASKKQPRLISLFRLYIYIVVMPERGQT